MTTSAIVTRQSPAEEYPILVQARKDFDRLILNKITANVWVAGGCIRDYLLTGSLKNTDIDFFGPSRHELAILAWELRKEFNFKPFLFNKNVIKGYAYIKGKPYKVDIVKKVFSTMEETIDAFDFTIGCFALNKETFVYHPSAPFDLLRRKLVINNLPFPLSTMQRMQKLIKRDYWICNGGLLEIAKAVSKIDFEDPEDNNIEFYPDGEARIVRFD